VIFKGLATFIFAEGEETMGVSTFGEGDARTVGVGIVCGWKEASMFLSC